MRRVYLGDGLGAYRTPSGGHVRYFTPTRANPPRGRVVSVFEAMKTVLDSPGRHFLSLCTLSCLRWYAQIICIVYVYD